MKKPKNYSAIHCWIRSHYGKANHCENPNCKHLSNSYDWALKQGYQYERDVNNFMQLCHSCHKNYDMTDQTRINLWLSKQFPKPVSLETRQKMSNSRKGKTWPSMGDYFKSINSLPRLEAHKKQRETLRYNISLLTPEERKEKYGRHNKKNKNTL